MRPFFYGATPGGPSMPHMGYHHYYRGGRGRPLRLFWFAIGAVSAVAWINHREKKAITAANSNGSPWEAQPQGGQGWGHGFGHGHGHGRGRKWDREEADSGSRMDYGGQRPMESSGPVAAPAPVPSYQAPVAPAPVAPTMQSEAIQPQVDQRWVDDKEKVREIARQASETVRLFPYLSIELLFTRDHRISTTMFPDVRAIRSDSRLHVSGTSKSQEREYYFRVLLYSSLSQYLSPAHG